MRKEQRLADTNTVSEEDPVSQPKIKNQKSACSDNKPLAPRNIEKIKIKKKKKKRVEAAILSEYAQI